MMDIEIKKVKLSELKPQPGNPRQIYKKDMDKLVYMIKNKINGKAYIGQTTQKLDKRIKQHLHSKNKNGINGALKKYGIDNFNITVIDTADSIQGLNELEKMYIEKYDCLSHNGYNLHTGGKNHKCSEITRKRLSEKAKGRSYSEETRQRMSAAGKNRIFTKTHRDNISLAIKGKKKTEQHINNLPQNQKGYYSGEKHPRALLKNEQIKGIKSLIRQGCRNIDIGIMYGINGRHVALIKCGRAYKDVG